MRSWRMPSVDQAVETLVTELSAEASTNRIRAAAQILDRSWGKPRQANDVRVERDHAESVAASRLKLQALLGQRHAARANGEGD